MNNLSNPMNPQINPMNTLQVNQPIENNSNSRTEIQEFFNYLNSQNNMNLKKIILFYSKYSKLCEQFVNSLHPNYKVILNMISVDNSVVRKRLMNSKYKLQYVPCIFMLFENGKVNVHYGNELVSLVTFLNKNMEAFMVIKTNENLAKRKNTLQSNQGITPLVSGKQQMNLDNNMDERPSSQILDETVYKSNRGNITSLNLPQVLGDKISQQKKLKMKNIPRIKEPIPEDFKRDMNIGISSKRMIPKGRKEHKKMARSSLTVLESNRQLDTIEEEEDTTDDDEEDTNIEMEDAEILDNILEEQEDNTIDPIISSKTKKDIKDIAAEMAKERGPIDDKPVIH
jgi:hypothetical protein